MTEVDMQAVRERLDREEERLHEQRQELRRDYAYQAVLFDAFEQATKVGRLGLIPSLAWLIYSASTAPVFTAADILVFGSMSMGLVYYGAPYAGSLTAYYWFRDTNLSTPRVASAITLLIDAAYLGWAIFLTC